jgi:hypothetical protein
MVYQSSAKFSLLLSKASGKPRLMRLKAAKPK